MKTRTSKKPTKRKAPTAAQMVGRIPKWLMGFEQRVNAKLKANDEAIAQLFVRLSVILNGSQEARQDNLATLPAIRESINDVIQMMHLYQTHFDDLAKNFGAGAISAINAGPSPEVLGYQSYCTDTRKPESVPPLPTEWAATTSSEAYAKYRESVQREGLPVATGYPCSFSHLHQPGIKCAVCQLTPPPAI